MRRISSDPRLPSNMDSMLRARLYELWRELSLVVNMGLMWSTEGTTAPTNGAWAVGDTCKNTSPSEDGTAGAKYVVFGWICTASGTPGTWLSMRALTGN